MADIRINGRRFPALQSIDSLSVLMGKINCLSQEKGSEITSLLINGMAQDIDSERMLNIKIDTNDVVEARLDTPQQLSYESLQVAQEMAELLTFDIKVATLALWEGAHSQFRSLETLLKDCQLFLQLAARPLDLLQVGCHDLPSHAIKCLKELDNIANCVEDAVLLCVHNNHKEAAHVLVARVRGAIERWLGLSAHFAQVLSLDNPESFSTPIWRESMDSPRIP